MSKKGQSRPFTVEYACDGEVASFKFNLFSGEDVCLTAMGILFLNDCSPGEDWRILDAHGNVVPFFSEAESTAEHYYNRPGEWDREEWW